MSDKKTILIIDDEYSIRDSLRSYFEDEDFIVFSAEDGEMGLDLFFKENIDLVLTDLRMPKKDGIEVMKTINKEKPDTPMIVISGAGRKEDIIKALRMGAKDYITKPIEDLDMVHHTITQALEHKRLNDQNIVYRKRIEKSEHQYRTITENIAEGVFTVDENENFTYSNQAFQDMIGFSDSQLLNKNLKDITSATGFRIIQEQTQERKKGIVSRYEIEMIGQNKISVHVELACSPLTEHPKKYSGAIAVARDITKIIEFRKKYESFKNQSDADSKDLIPICASCKNIRIKSDDWVPVEDYFTKILFSHGICPSCCEKLYPEFDFSELDTDNSKA